MEEFLEKLGMRESSNNYKAKNKLGYLGKYQFGGDALKDAGYRDLKTGEWTGKNGVKSEEDFLNNTEAQEEAIKTYTKKQRGYLKNNGAIGFIGKKFKDVPITESGLVAAAHLVGAKKLSDGLKNNIDYADGNGTPASEYLRTFKGIDLSEKGDNVKKEKSLEELEQLREQIKLPIKKEEVVDPATSLGFENGGAKYTDILSQMGLPKIEEREQYITPENLPVSDLTALEKEREQELIKSAPIEEPKKVARVRDAGESPNMLEQLEADADYEAAGNSPSDNKKPELTMNELEKRYEKLMEASKNERSTAAWATAATQVAAMLDKFSAVPVGIQPIQFQANQSTEDMKQLIALGKMKGLGQNNQMSAYQKGMLAQGQQKIDLAREKQGSAKTGNSDFNKEISKLQAKDFIEAGEKALAARSNSVKLENAFDKFINYSKNSKFGGTGPIATMGGLKSYVDEETQELDAVFKELTLDEIKSFAGMSKTVDSDAERRFLEQTQPSTTNDDSVNAQIILGGQAANLRVIKESEAKAEYLANNPKGDMTGYVSPYANTPHTVVVDPSTGKMTLVPKSEVSEIKSKGLMSVDEYADYALTGKLKKTKASDPSLEKRIQRVLDANPGATRKAVMDKLKAEGKI